MVELLDKLDKQEDYMKRSGKWVWCNAGECVTLGDTKIRNLLGLPPPEL